MIIAIDGPSGSGKTTTAKEVAKKLGYVHINTGAMYRAITFKVIINNINLKDGKAILELLDKTTIEFISDGSKIILDNMIINDDLYSNDINMKVSIVSAIPEVREKLVKYQKKIAKGKNVVLEGRDIGTVVFPNAEFKFFLNADINIRAMRRKKQIEKLGRVESIDVIKKILIDRDSKDESRQDSPLLMADDAIEIDTTNLSIQSQVENIINIVTTKKEMYSKYE